MLDEGNTKYLYEYGSFTYKRECAKFETEFSGLWKQIETEEKFTDIWLVLWITSTSSREHNKRKEMLLNIIQKGCPG